MTVCEFGSRALEIGTRLESTLLTANAQENVAAILSSHRGERDEARRRLLAATSAYRKLGLRFEEARALHHLAFDFHFAGERESAISQMQGATALVGDDAKETANAIWRGLLGMFHWENGDYAEARTEHEACVRLGRGVGHQTCVQRSLLYLAHLRALDGEWKEADRLLEEGRAWFRTVDAHDQALPETIAGKMAVLRGNYDQGVQWFERALAREETTPWQRAFFHFELMQLERQRGRSEESEKHRRRSARIFRQQNSPGWVRRLDSREPTGR